MYLIHCDTKIMKCDSKIIFMNGFFPRSRSHHMTQEHRCAKCECVHIFRCSCVHLKKTVMFVNFKVLNRHSAEFAFHFSLKNQIFSRENNAHKERKKIIDGKKKIGIPFSSQNGRALNSGCQNQHIILFLFTRWVHGKRQKGSFEIPTVSGEYFKDNYRCLGLSVCWGRT